MRPLAVVPMLVLLISGCVFHHGRQTALMSGSGAHGVVVARSSGTPAHIGEYRGELLEVQDSGLLILSDRVITYIAFRAIQSAEFRNVRTADGARLRASLPSLARYAHGLTEEQRRRLLDAHGQKEPVRVGVLNPAAAAHDVESFLAVARRAAAPYHRVERAIAAGYRKLGPSFPGMGEHWIHPGLIVSGDIDPARPPVLCYERVDGETRLVALAFTVPLEAEERPPDYPVGRHSWHDHADRVDEEVLLLAHPASHGSADGPRLAMFHAWLWLDNPDGQFAQNNWRLPFLRAGLAIPDINVSADAARGLSLWTADADYYPALFEAAAQLGSVERSALRELLATHREHAARWVREAQRDGVVTRADLAAIEEVWSSLWNEIPRVIAPATWDRVRVLR